MFTSSSGQQDKKKQKNNKLNRTLTSSHPVHATITCSVHACRTEKVMVRVRVMSSGSALSTHIYWAFIKMNCV